MVYIFDVIFSFILLTALYMKAIDYQDSRYEVFSYGFISYKYTGGLLILVLIVEAVLAMCFIFGKYAIQASLFTALLFIFFVFAQLYKKHNKANNKCSCFGKVAWLNKMPITRNLILICFLMLRVPMAERSVDIRSSLIELLLIIVIIMLLDFVQTFVNSSERNLIL